MYNSRFNEKRVNLVFLTLKVIQESYLAIVEWGCVGYEEFCRSRRVFNNLPGWTFDVIGWLWQNSLQIWPTATIHGKLCVWLQPIRNGEIFWMNNTSFYLSHDKPCGKLALGQNLSRLWVAQFKLCGYVFCESRQIYSCFEKCCPRKPYATMPKGIMGNVVHEGNVVHG